jgi:glutaredoxin
MKRRLTLYSRKDCCLCSEINAVIGEVAQRIPVELEVIDVDDTAELRERYGSEVPVLFIDGRKAFKYRVTSEELEKHLNQSNRSWMSRLRFGTGGGSSV